MERIVGGLREEAGAPTAGVAFEPRPQAISVSFERAICEPCLSYSDTHDQRVSPGSFLRNFWRFGREKNS